MTTYDPEKQRRYWAVRRMTYNARRRELYSLKRYGKIVPSPGNGLATPLRSRSKRSMPTTIGTCRLCGRSYYQKCLKAS